MAIDEAKLAIRRGQVAAKLPAGSQAQRDYVAAQGKLDAQGRGGKAADVPLRHLEESTTEDEIMGHSTAHDIGSPSSY